MPNKLDEIVANKRVELADRMAARPAGGLWKQVVRANGRFLTALKEPGVRLIAEVKPKSPSAGELGSSANGVEQAKKYAIEAAAISVLTDAKYFGGSIELLRQISNSVTVPTLCKDFILDEYQIVEARVNGAEAILLIVKILTDHELQQLHSATKALGMTPIVEVQTEEEMQRAKSVVPDVILINNRNLADFEIDLATTERLAPVAPASALVVSASGIETRADIERLLPSTRRFLIGTSLMRCNDPAQKLAELKGTKICAN